MDNMTLIFDGNVEEFVGIFGTIAGHVLGEEALELMQDAAKELDGRVKINISNGRYSFDMHMEGDIE